MDHPEPVIEQPLERPAQPPVQQPLKENAEPAIQQPASQPEEPIVEQCAQQPAQSVATQSPINTQPPFPIGEHVSEPVPSKGEEPSLAQEAFISAKIFQIKLKQASELKNKGNSHFKNKLYFEAIQEYTSALKILEPTHFYGATPDECKEMAALSSNLLCNLGYCYFSSHDMKRADIFLSEAIVINPKYTKALHKRALARHELGRIEEAFEDIKQAFSLDKSNAEIHSAYSRILEKYNEELKKSKEQMKELSSKIFNASTKKQEESPLKQQDKKEEGKSLSWFNTSGLVGFAAVAGYQLYRLLKK